MVDPQAFHSVVRHLTEGKEKGSKRPMVAVRVWSALFQYLPPDGNEVRAGREEIAAAAGCTPNDVSHVMRELQAIGAISSRRRGRLVTYEVNPLVGTHLTGTVRDKVQAEAPKLRLIEPA